MQSLTIGLIQQYWHPDPEEHRARLSASAASAVSRGAQLICLQELTLSPYFATRTGVDASPYAETIPNGPTCQFARDLAQQTGALVTASLFEAARPGYNTAICFAPTGEMVGKTRKQHIPAGPGYHENEHFHPGDSDYPVHTIAGVPTALPTCYDQ